MNICIVDDEQNCIDNLSSHLLMYASEKGHKITFDTYKDGDSFKNSFSPDKYDIIFFDIYIGEDTGMDLARHVRSLSESAMIVFCTTSISDMPEAFRYHAFEYVIKPAEYERISKILDDAIVVLPNLEQYVDLQTGKDRIHFAISDLISVTTQGHYLSIAIKNREVETLRMSLMDFAKNIENDERFLAINKGVIVNLNHITKIENKEATMTDGQILPIRSREAAAIKRTWQDFKIEAVRKGQKIRYE